MLSSRIIWLGGVAATIGGFMWVVKGTSILLTDYQPPLVYEAAMLFFAIGLLGLGARLDGLHKRLRTAGIFVALVTAISAVIALATDLTPFIAIAGFGPFLGLILLGSASLQARIFPSPWRALPLAMGLGGPLLVLAGGGLALIDERLLEVPIALLGLAWMLLGYAVLTIKNATSRSSARAG